MKVEFQAKAYLAKYSPIEGVMNGSNMPLIYAGESKYYEGEGYPCIGDVTVIINVHTKDQIIANQIAALQSKLQTVRAENQKRVNTILDELSKLQAITMSPAA